MAGEPVVFPFVVDDGGVKDGAIYDRGGDRGVRETLAHFENVRFEVVIIEPCSYRQITSWKNKLAASPSMGR
ncbi:hypothetical protein V3M53_04540 [Trueperella pyogenes]